MRLLFDEQLSEELVPLLADLFPGSLHVRLLGGQGAGDQVVWQMALDHACMLVTKDEDSHRLSVLRGAPPKVVWASFLCRRHRGQRRGGSSRIDGGSC